MWCQVYCNMLYLCLLTWYIWPYQMSVIIQIIIWGTAGYNFKPNYWAVMRISLMICMFLDILFLQRGERGERERERENAEQIKLNMAIEHNNWTLWPNLPPYPLQTANLAYLCLKLQANPQLYLANYNLSLILTGHHSQSHRSYSHDLQRKKQEHRHTHLKHVCTRSYEIIYTKQCCNQRL